MPAASLWCVGGPGPSVLALTGYATHIAQWLLLAPGVACQPAQNTQQAAGPARQLAPQLVLGHLHSLQHASGSLQVFLPWMEPQLPPAKLQPSQH